MEEMDNMGAGGDIHLASLNYTDIDTLTDLQMAKAKSGSKNTTKEGGDGDGKKNGNDQV